MLNPFLPFLFGDRVNEAVNVGYSMIPVCEPDPHRLMILYMFPLLGFITIGVSVFFTNRAAKAYRLYKEKMEEIS